MLKDTINTQKALDEHKARNLMKTSPKITHPNGFAKIPQKILKRLSLVTNQLNKSEYALFHYFLYTCLSWHKWYTWYKIPKILDDVSLSLKSFKGAIKSLKEKNMILLIDNPMDEKTKRKSKMMTKKILVINHNINEWIFNIPEIDKKNKTDEFLEDDEFTDEELFKQLDEMDN